MSETRSPHPFEIQQATSDDAVGIGLVHLQATVDTYPNEELGITAEWLTKTYTFLTDESGIDYRKGTVKEAETDPDHNLYQVCKDEQGKVVGFVHATKNQEKSKLEALYLLQEARGTGVADEMIRLAIDFAGNLPMELGVAQYNSRAIAFYERHGFRLMPSRGEFVNEIIPVVPMIRSAEEGET